ncbi:MAG: hypothetical protein AAGG68_11465 [Bacteroidota bacterium]
MKTHFIYSGAILLLLLFSQCDDTKSEEKVVEEKPKIEITNIGVAAFESVNLEEGRHKSGINRTQNEREMTYTWSKAEQANVYLFQLLKNGEEIKSMRTQETKVRLKMNEFRGFRRGDQLEVRVSNIYGRGKPVFTRTYRATSLATGGTRMREQEMSDQNQKRIRYEWKAVEGASQYRFTLAIKAFQEADTIKFVDTIINTMSISFNLDHLTKGDQIQSSVEPLQGTTSLKVPETTTALYANGIARHDIVLLAKSGSTITTDALDGMLAGASCESPTKIAFEEGTYITDQGEITLEGKQHANQFYDISTLKTCLESIDNFMNCLQNTIPELPDGLSPNCTHNPAE